MIQSTQTQAQNASRDAARGSRDLRPTLTTQQRLEAIEQMLVRVNQHAEFMRGVEALRGTSAEAKEAAVVAFHERMIVLERQLGQISEGLRLG